MSKERYRLITEYPKDEFFDNKQVVKFDSYEVIRTLNQQADKIDDLEAKLAESEHRNEQLVDALNGEVFINYKLPMENAQIKQQLAEKEQDIEEINKEFVQAVKDWKSLVEKKNKDIVELEEHDNLYHNQLAIAELERAKIEFGTYYADNIWNYPQYLEDRIKLLKEGK